MEATNTQARAFQPNNQIKIDIKVMIPFASLCLEYIMLWLLQLALVDIDPTTIQQLSQGHSKKFAFLNYNPSLALKGGLKRDRLQ